MPGPADGAAGGKTTAADRRRQLCAAGHRLFPPSRQRRPVRVRVLLLIDGLRIAVIYLPAIAARVDMKASLRRPDESSDSTPVPVDLKPTGEFHMEDPCAAGGIGAVLR